MGFPYSSGDVLTAADMNAIGEYTGFAPSWTNLTVGNATETWAYAVVNKVIIVTGRTTFGSTTAITGSVDMTIPGGYQIAWQNQVCGGVQYQIGGTHYQGFIDTVSQTAIRFRQFTVNGSLLVRGSINASNPATFGSGSQIKGTFTARIL